jgi:uncharacterized protein YndB with AHSA1/START domain
VTYELRLERLFDAPPEVVFDTIVDPTIQEELFSGVVEGWGLLGFDIDLRVGGTWTVVFGPTDGRGEPDRLTHVFTDIDRPQRLEYRTSMYVSEWGRTVEFTETITFEEQDGKTLLTLVNGGFASQADRDAFLDGVPSWLDALQRVVAKRMTEGTG